MGRVAIIKPLRTTRANLNAQRDASGLIVGEIYNITDETGKMAKATAVNAYEDIGGTHTQAESTITFTDITTGNATASAHGFLPKLDGQTTTYLRGDGSWQTPSSGGETVNAEYLTADKTLTVSDSPIQMILTTSNRNIYLPTSGLTVGLKFEIWNRNAITSTYNITIYYSTTIVAYVSPCNTTCVRWDGTNWIVEFGGGFGVNNTGNGNYGTGIGKGCSNNSGYGVGIGYNSSNNYTSGIGIGNTAFQNNNNGIGIGASSNYNHTGGVGVGYAASNNNNYGVGVGAYAKSNDKGACTVAIGAYSKADNNRELTSDSSESTGTYSSFVVQKYKYKDLASNSAAWQQLYIDGSSASFVITQGVINNCLIQINAIDTVNYTSKAWEVKCAFRRDYSTNVVMVGTPVITVIGAETGAANWDVQISIDTTNRALKIEVKHDSANSVRFTANAIMTRIKN